MRTRPPASFQPGFLVPAIIGFALIADAGMRLALPADRVSYRVWEAMRTFGSDTPFRRASRYDRPRVYGNLAALGNQPDLRQPHRVVFSTDSLGYHNPPGLAGSGVVRALLFGSSFSAGTEVSDGQDLAAQLTRRTGRAVYNAAPGDPFPVTVAALADRLRLQHGVVIYEYFAGTGAPAPRLRPPEPESVRCRAVLGPLSTPPRCRALTRLLQRLRIAPLGVFAWRAYRRLRDDRWLPNNAARRVVRARLVNGDEMLFLSEAEVQAEGERREQPATEYAAWLERQLAAQGLALLVVLVPEKYAVYGPLLVRPEAAAEHAGTPDLAGIERDLRARGIPVVNLTKPLRQAARRELARRRYVFWRDDTHWNAAGVHAAAAAIAPVLVPLLRR